MPAKSDESLKPDHIRTRADADAQMMAAFRGLTEPIAEAQKVEAQENTKQVQSIQAGETDRQKHRLIFAGLIVMLVAVIACVAMLTGHDTIAQDIVIAAISFAGGFGAGKAVNDG